MTKTILCYGDSNTWGQLPLRAFRKERYPADVRWPGRLQQLAMDRYKVIEEGLNGRTTGPEDPNRAGRSGIKYLAPCIDSHVPLDLIVLMLGTNDLKKFYHPEPREISERVRELIRLTKKILAEDANAKTQVLVIAPGIPNRAWVDFEPFQYEDLEPFARALPALYARVSQEEGVHFLDGSPHLIASAGDGCHLDAEVHVRFADIVLNKIDRIFGNTN